MATPLTAEMLLWVLTQPGVMTVAGFNGSCERVIRYDAFCEELMNLIRNNPDAIKGRTKTAVLRG